MFISFSVFSLSIIIERYYQKDEKWYFGYGRSQDREIVDVDNLTFQIIDLPQPAHSKWIHGGNLHFAKDKNYVYYKGERIEDANPETFEITPRSEYSKDDKSIYFETKKIIDGIDVKQYDFLFNFCDRNFTSLDAIAEFLPKIPDEYEYEDIFINKKSKLFYLIKQDKNGKFSLIPIKTINHS